MSLQLNNKIIVIKFGGNALTDQSIHEFSQAINTLCTYGAIPVIVHGGGPQINKKLEQLNIKPKFINGLRYTDEKVLTVAEMVLSGSVNKKLVQFINQTGQTAVGISGKDGKLLVAKKIKDPIDLGLVGEIVTVNTDVLQAIIQHQLIPVISPIAYNDTLGTLNINADIAASKIAKALNAYAFIFMSNISGLLDQNKKLINHINRHQIKTLIDNQIITAGMIPKIQSAVDALDTVSVIKIINGYHSNYLLTCLDDDNIGTTITK